MEMSVGLAPDQETAMPPRPYRQRDAWLAALLAAGRRIAALLMVLVVISFGIFVLLGAAPGSPIDTLIGPGGNPSPQQIHALKAKYDLDKPFLTRYVLWLGKAARLDFGDSVQSGQSVNQLLRQRIGVTALLIAYSAIIALGVVAALRKGTTVDRGLTMIGLTGVSVPAFATSLVLLYLLTVLLQVFPSTGDGVGLGDQLWHLTLPAIALSFTTLGYVMRLTRTSMIDTLGRDYVTFARARGLARRKVVRDYALRNALIPVMTASVLVITSFLTSTVLVEVTFNITGLGSLLVSAVQSQDIPVVQGVAMTIAVAVVVTNILIELLYVVVDPRIRAGDHA
jgi:peptide/nickel transport system permease protein